MQANSWHHKLLHFHLSFWILKCRKEGKKLNNFFDEIENIFYYFLRGIIDKRKIKVLLKIVNPVGLTCSRACTYCAPKINKMYDLQKLYKSSWKIT